MHNSHAMFKWFKEQPGNMGIRTLSMKYSFTCAKFLLNKKYVYVQFVKVGGGVNLQICFNVFPAKIIILVLTT